MTSTLTALLYLGLFLSRTVSTEKQNLSKPIIWAKPDFMIPKGKQALIFCQGTPEAVNYQLYFEGHLFLQQSPKQHGRRNIAMFHIPAMTPLTAGQYKCIYRSKKLWSNPSDPLDLVVTEDFGDTSLAPTEHTSFSDYWDLDLVTTEAEFQQDLASWDHTAQNLLRIILAFLVLVALMCLLAEDWLWRKRAQEKANGASSQECRRRFRTQRRLNE
ncbi:natural cytotoxicity triggering receptor 1 isoform X7 [Mustela erminea]|uniref:natural cytotoxicity triggering receptor 1 isoform X7 n=1 Tax=Mustela erminea TaxID=36723 RepID=UPI001386F9F6|nr:natural cytotoxicity triggering receptor 1 isoform X7 [Mustela erminea]